tara:strand:- start:523 stop:825 length:303 start_codon:yes stop_codon:yes gene_type:complete
VIYGIASHRCCASKDSNDPEQLRLLQMFRDRVLEEFYGLQADLDCTNNLMDNPEYKGHIEKYQADLNQWMTNHKKPGLRMFEHRDSKEKMKNDIKNHYPK